MAGFDPKGSTPGASRRPEIGSRPIGVRFVTVRLIHPARNRLPRDFIS